MTRSEKIKWLRKADKLDEEIFSILEDLEYWKAKATNVTAQISGVPGPGGGIKDKVQESVVKIVDLENMYNARLKDLIDWKKNIEKTIWNVADPQLRAILRYRYIDGLTWSEISRKMCYSLSQIYSLHRKAIDQIIIAEKDNS